MSEDKRNNKSKFIIIGIIIAVIAIVGIGVIFSRQKTKNTSTKTEIDSKESSSSISKVDGKQQNLGQEITTSDKITIDNCCEFNITGTTFVKDVLPSNPTGYYTYLQGKDDSQKYCEITMNVKNLKTSAVKQDSLLSVKLKYDNNYEYMCMLVTEDASGEKLETYPNLYSIDPLKNLKYRFVADVPKEIETDGKPLQAVITANGNIYVYNIR